MQLPECILVDARNIDAIEAQIIAEIQSATLVGFDLETQDVNAHAGIKALRKETDDGDKLAKGKFVFDWNAMVVTGFSLYPDGSPHAYYINLNHADVANRISWERAKKLLDSKGESTSFVCHNAPFEITVMKTAYGYELKDVICTLQMAVSAYGPDEYDRSQYPLTGLGDIVSLFPDAERLFGKRAEAINANAAQDADVDVEETKNERLSPKQNELLIKVIGKSSIASYSYNGLVRSLAYTYGLKEMVKKFFGYQMSTFDETLGESRHMGELTGQEVVNYGCEDSFWAVQLFYKLSNYIMENSPEVLGTFFEQENPMIHVYANVRCEGMKVNRAAIEKRRDEERKTFAQLVRDIKRISRELMPFRTEPDRRLCMDKWYGEANKAGAFGYDRYRKQFEAWANSPDFEDDYKQAIQVSSPVSNAWAGGKCNGLSIGHYFQTRLMIYDLCQLDTVVYKGKIQSDGETRGELRERVGRFMTEHHDDPVLVEHWQRVDKLLSLLGEMAQLETRMKLYLTPYMLLTDPVTSRMYPEISSMLASRRMAASNPNPMQLAKRGESVFVRGFYVPDSDDEVYVSLDWSQVELVEIGDFSGDPEFAKAFGQIPYNDLHLGAAADVLQVMVPEVTYDMLKNMHNMTASELPAKLLIKPNGDPLTPKDAKKFWRTEVGKGSNFNYWYSGALSTVGEKLGWTSKQMWEATERYRERFIIAEKWRVDTIEQARWNGFITLPDHHRRVRWEATYEWANLTQRMFDAYGSDAVTAFGKEIIRSVKTRAGNQIVNSLIQGSSATLAKRSILAIIKACEEQGIRARFKMPIHDELLFSVHRDDVVKFIKLAKSLMMHHPEIIKNLKLYATASIGLTFQPFDDIKAPLGQIELDEAPAILGFGDGVILDDTQIEYTVNWLFERREKANG